MTLLNRWPFFFVMIATCSAVSLLAAPGGVSIKWVDQGRQEISVTSELSAKEAKECIMAGLELEHRFLIKFCEKLERFGSSCEDSKRVVHNFSFDPIQESYRVAKDRLDDRIDPERFSFSTFESALSDAASVHQLPLAFVAEEKEFLRFQHKEGKWNLGVRVRTTCKGEVPQFLADVSYFLSFGMIDLYGNDTGWEYFDLQPDRIKRPEDVVKDSSLGNE